MYARTTILALALMADQPLGVRIQPVNKVQNNIDTPIVSDIVRGIAIGTDGLVLVMTWIKTYSIYQASRRANIRAGISELLLRDGEHVSDRYTLTARC